MNKFQGKKVLFLGATGYIADLVLRAKKHGIYTIVTDYFENAPAKQVADKYYDVSTVDLAALEMIARNEHIDGVVTGFSDVNLDMAQQLCSKLNLPFYANHTQVENTTNKLKFKELCRECGIPVAKQYHITNSPSSADLEEIEYPVIIKPADSYGSKGISVCKDKNEFMQAYTNALKFSKTDQVIVEKFISGYDDVCMYYTIQDGYVSLSAMTDRDMNNQQIGKAPQPNGLFYPSEHLDQYYEQLHSNVCKLVKRLEIKNGTMFIQAFANEDEFIVFEMGYRLCGAAEYIIIDEENGINSAEMYINYALTGKFDGYSVKKMDNPYFKHYYCILLSLLKSGKIGKISGLTEIKKMPELVNIVEFYREGDIVENKTTGTLNQTFARMYVKGNSKEELLNSIEKIQKTLLIEDENGQNMLLEGIDCSKYRMKGLVSKC